MASSVVDICNMALSALGQARIVSAFPPDNSAQARACNDRYETTRDEVLRAHLWNCATKRVKLNKLAAAPAWGATNNFQLPDDFIRFNSLNRLDVGFRIEGGDQGRVLLSDDDEVLLRYVFRLITVPQMDELLKSCIAARLAAEICLQLTQDKKLMGNLFAIYFEKMSEAQFTDSMESPVETITDPSWVEARLGSSDERYREIDVEGTPQ